jgi:radical SAM protein with 4Fe4S-binding SPASM domain
VFGFGEPTLDSGLSEKVAYCSDLNLETYITTNAGALDMDLSENLLDAGIKHIRFSFHAIRPIDYESVHKNLNWLRSLRNFANFITLNEKRGHPCTVHISCIPMHKESVSDIRRTWERYADYLEVWRPHNWGGMKTFREVNQRKKTCGRPFSGPVQIQADGSVIPCCFLTNSEIILGNVNDQSIRDILDGFEYARLRKAHNDGNLDGYACKMCDQLNVNDINPLLYSNRDQECCTDKTSTCKVSVNQ